MDLSFVINFSVFLPLQAPWWVWVGPARASSCPPTVPAGKWRRTTPRSSTQTTGRSRRRNGTLNCALTFALQTTATPGTVAPTGPFLFPYSWRGYGFIVRPFISDFFSRKKPCQISRMKSIFLSSSIRKHSTPNSLLLPDFLWYTCKKCRGRGHLYPFTFFRCCVIRLQKKKLWRGQWCVTDHLKNFMAEFIGKQFLSWIDLDIFLHFCVYPWCVCVDFYTE